jgi:hypothetical protein
MKSSVALLLILFSAAPALAQSSWQQQKCDKGQMPTPNGCMQVCPPGSSIGKDASGYQTCLRDGNITVREAIVGTGALNATRQRKYAFLPIAAGNDVDGICFGIRSDERVETVNDDRFVYSEWHVHRNRVYVAEISYALDPGLTKLHLTGFRAWRLDGNNKLALGQSFTADVVVPLYDTPQANWPCTKQQWATVMTPPEKVLQPPPIVTVVPGVPNPVQIIPPHLNPGEYYPGQNWHTCGKEFCNPW